MKKTEIVGRELPRAAWPEPYPRIGEKEICRREARQEYLRGEGRR